MASATPGLGEPDAGGVAFLLLRRRLELLDETLHRRRQTIDPRSELGILLPAVAHGAAGPRTTRSSGTALGARSASRTTSLLTAGSALATGTASRTAALHAHAALGTTRLRTPTTTAESLRRRTEGRALLVARGASMLRPVPAPSTGATLPSGATL